MSTPETIDWDALFPGCYNASDFDGRESTVTISALRREELTKIGRGGTPTGETEEKPVVLFSDAAKKLVLNKTNAALIAAMHGKKTSQWVGKRITLHAEAGCGFGKPGVRVCGSPDIAKEVRATIGLPPDPKRVYVLRKTGAAPEPKKGPRPSLAEVLDDHGLTWDALDAWCTANGKAPLSAGSPSVQQTAADWLSGSPDRLDEVRRHVADTEADPADSDLF